MIGYEAIASSGAEISSTSSWFWELMAGELGISFKEIYICIRIMTDVTRQTKERFRFEN